MTKPTSATLGDVALVASDLDGTLLDANGQVPSGLWERCRALAKWSVPFVPASGRPLNVIEEMFAPLGPLTAIADNGAVVALRGQIIHESCLEAADLERVWEAIEDYADTLRPVVSTPEGTLVTAGDEALAAEAVRSFAQVRTVRDIRRAALSVRVRKVAVFDFSSDASGRALIDGLVSSPAPQCSGGRWIDFCAPDATKGVALMILADALGVDPTRAAVFGDGENDRSLFAKAGYRFAVAGAHPALMVEATHVVADASHGGVLDGLDAIVQAKESQGAAEGFAIG